jgi:hypothetical protein
VNTHFQSRTVPFVTGVVRKHLRRGFPVGLKCRATYLIPLFFLSSIFCWSQSPGPTETQVKAAYLYNFGKFVTWQTDRAANLDLEICVLGKDPFGTVLDSTVAGDKVGGRKIVARRINRIEEGNSCGVLFIASSEEKRLGAILAAARHLEVLTVSDMPHFAEQGGMIGLVTQGDRIRFEVNLGAAKQSHLALSSELLKVATRVIGKGAPS